MKKSLKVMLVLVGIIAMLMGLTACTGAQTTTEAGTQAQTQGTEAQSTQEEAKSFKIGLCNFVDDASLNQICNAIQDELKAIGEATGATFEVVYDNPNADANVLSQIATKFISSEKVDLIIAVATPVAMTMQAATEDNKIPVVFAAVSDPLGAQLVNTMEAPGANITGTSDALNTGAILNLISLQIPDLKKVGLLYDLGQDSSTAAIQEAKAYLASKNIEVVERTGTTVDEVGLAAQALVNEGVQAVFTPTDNTIMQAELSIAETFTKAGVLHYCGADSFALNGAFLGYGVNYENLGQETAKMAADILINALDPATVPVKTFDNGIATINEDVCATLSISLEDAVNAVTPYCTKVVTLKTAEEF